MNLSHYKALLCEGAFEEAIMDLLLDSNSLIFNRNELIDQKPLRIRKAINFERQYLRKSYDDKISVIRILDSKNEIFKLSKAYEFKVDVINVVTSPEIEMLIIINENKYNQFYKSGLKPSEFCKTKLRLFNVKSYDFVKTYFSNVKNLINSIIKYDSLHIKSSNFTLKDLLK